MSAPIADALTEAAVHQVEKAIREGLADLPSELTLEQHWQLFTALTEMLPLHWRFSRASTVAKLHAERVAKKEKK